MYRPLSAVQPAANPLVSARLFWTGPPGCARGISCNHCSYFQAGVLAEICPDTNVHPRASPWGAGSMPRGARALVGPRGPNQLNYVKCFCSLPLDPFPRPDPPPWACIRTAAWAPDASLPGVGKHFQNCRLISGYPLIESAKYRKILSAGHRGAKMANLSAFLSASKQRVPHHLIRGFFKF
jgi:hypothetical protein